jgi:hypothetical protein
MKRCMIFLLFFLTVSGFTDLEKTGNVYRYYSGKIDDYKIWIVDGNQVRLEIYKEFLYGGNEQRYVFTPEGEIWIDNAISCEEFDLTVAHELNERHLMAKFGWTYEAAHDSSLSLEQFLRHRNLKICEAHEASLRKVSVLDSYNKKEIRNLPDSIELRNIYRVPEGKRDSISIWIVDGYMIRKNIYPDFGFSGNDMAYHFIPPREIWIDGQVSCEETGYSISLELKERQLMTQGSPYSEAYEEAVQMVRENRKLMKRIIKSQPRIIIPYNLERDSGVINPGERDFSLHIFDLP